MNKLQDKMFSSILIKPEMANHFVPATAQFAGIIILVVLHV